MDKTEDCWVWTESTAWKGYGACNPAHLFVGTRFDNMQDAQRAHMAIREAKNSRAQLTTEQVAEIRRRYTHACREGLARARPPLPVAPMPPITR